MDEEVPSAIDPAPATSEDLLSPVHSPLTPSASGESSMQEEVEPDKSDEP